jgi:DNA transposition AAA+ family ATPase
MADIEEVPPDLVDATRARVRLIVKTEKRTVVSLAKEIGVGDSTFAAWLAGKYAGDNESVAIKVSTWLDARESMAKARLSLPPDVPETITHTQDLFIAALEQAQMVPDIAVLIGGAGVGKSTACRRYKATRPNVWLITADPSLASPAAMLDCLSEEVGAPETVARRRSRAIIKRLTDTKGLIIIDEANHLATAAIEQLRAIQDAAGVGLAFAGTQRLWSRIDGGGRKAEFAQLYSRVGIRVSVARPFKRDIEAVLDAAQVEDSAVRGRLATIAGKGGALRSMNKTLRMARLLATGTGEELTARHVDVTWERLSGIVSGSAS